MKAYALAISLSLLVSGLAHAQGALERVTGAKGEQVSVSSKWSKRLTPAEAAYGARFAETLRIQRALTVRQIDLSYAIGEEEGTARGVAFQFGPDDTLRRLRFPTRKAAQDFALHAVRANRRVGVQVIENQVVVIAGPSLSDPARMWTAFDAAWKGLPLQGKPVERSAELSLVFTGPQTFLVSSFLNERPELDEALEKRGEELDRAGLATCASLGFLAATDASTQGARERYLQQAREYQGRRAKPMPTKPTPAKLTPAEPTPATPTKPRPKKKGLLERLKGLRDLRLGWH